jgi:hypothetical protein
MRRNSKLPEGMTSQDDLQRVIDRLTAVLEDECGDNLGAWGAITMVLLSIICDIAQADIQEVADSLKNIQKGRLQ